MGETRHSAFLHEKDGKLHFGCENPFCCHPLVPNHWAIPLEAGGFKMELVSHEREKKEIAIKVTMQVAAGGLPAGTARTVTCRDEINACAAAFEALWPEIVLKKERGPRFV